MPLTLYRFHTPECKQDLLAKGLPVKAHRDYRDCECMIYITGTTENGSVPRTSTNIRDWKTAASLARSMDADSKDCVVHGLTLNACFTTYLDSRKNEIRGKAMGQYKLLFDRMKVYATQQNKTFIRECDVDFYENFKQYGLPEMQDTSKSTITNKLRCFLKEAFRRGWITEALAQKVKSYASEYEQKQPFTLEEVDRILECAKTLNGGINGFASCGPTFSLLLRLLAETGMRCGDGIRYNPLSCTKGESMWVYKFLPQKTKRNKRKPKPAQVYLTDELKSAIDKCDWLSKKLPFAYLPVTQDETTDKTTYMANEVYARMKSIGKTCSVEDCRPHRLRDTFAYTKLMDGFLLEDVSRLLYHSSIVVTEKYYAAWVPNRESRLERMCFESQVKALRNRLGDS